MKPSAPNNDPSARRGAQTGRAASGPSLSSDALKRAALLVSPVALALMAGGLAWALLDGRWALPGDSVLPLERFWNAPPALTAMSAGILLLILLPGIQVAMILAAFVRRQSRAEIIVAAVLLAELAAAMLIRWR